MTEYQICDSALFNVSRYDSNAVHTQAFGVLMLRLKESLPYTKTIEITA